VLAVLVIIYVIIKKHHKVETTKINVPEKTEQQTEQKTEQEAVPTDFSDQVIVETDSTVEKVQISTGKVEPANALEQENFNNFAGLPKLGDNKKEDTEQSNVLVALDKSKAIVTITIYNSAVAPNKSDGSQPILSTQDYVCDIAGKSCQQTDILSQDYQGINAGDKVNLIWSNWDAAKNLLFGHLVRSEGTDTSPVYVCDIQNKTCNKTEQNNLVVPQGAFSPSLDKFVIVNQNDDPNVTTGKQWDLLLYTRDDLTKPMQSYDISAAINQDENFAYDSVYSVAWSQDEKSLAIATSRKIFMFDLATEALSLAYTDPATSDDDLNLDSSSLSLSSNGKYIVFVDSADNGDDKATADDETVNTLKRIDLENNNEISEILSDKGLSLK
jgi:hypothetical protein